MPIRKSYLDRMKALEAEFQKCLLTDGSRKMLADFDMNNFKFLNWLQILANAQYPNAYLTDGSRPLRGTFEQYYYQYEKYAQLDPRIGLRIRYGWDAPKLQFLVLSDRVDFAASSPSDIRGFEWLINDSRANFLIWGDREISFGLHPTQGNAGVLLDGEDLYLKAGYVTSLPTADASYRGKKIRVEGGAGVRDRTYECMKSDSDTYSWVEIANGGA